jgi:hypothetical protein
MVACQRLRCLAASAVAGVLLGCASSTAPSEADGPPTFDVPAARTVCGFQQLEAADRPVVVSARDASPPVTAGLSRVVVRGEPSATYGSFKSALEPARTSLVRVKVVVGERWLLPLTFKRPVHPHPPSPSNRWISHVGKRRVTRSAEAPAERLADLRLAGDRATLVVENEAPGGRELSVAELAAALRRIDPPVGVFALTATDDTPWPQFVEALTAAACFDRKPGQEPHEIIFD